MQLCGHAFHLSAFSLDWRAAVRFESADKAGTGSVASVAGQNATHPVRPQKVEVLIIAVGARRDSEVYASATKRRG